MTLLDVVLIAAAGFVGGAINALAGGGSLILFPVLVATGLSPLAANVTNTVASLPGGVGGVVGFAPVLRGRWRSLVPIAAAGATGSAVGGALLLLTPAAAFDVVVPVLVLLASVLLALQPMLTRRFGSRDAADDGRIGRTAVVAIGIATIYGGYFGGAMGVVLISVLALTVRDALSRLNAVKAVLSLVDCTAGVVIFALFGPVSWAAVAVAAPTALVGGYLGARVARHVDDRVLRPLVVVLGVSVAIWLAVS